MSENNPPELKLRDKGVLVTIWKNSGEDDKVFYSSTIEKVYKKDDEWHSTNSLGEMDVLVASRLLNKAYDAIAEFKMD